MAKPPIAALVFLALPLSLAGCQSGGDARIEDASHTEYVEERQKIIGSADWNRTIHVTMELVDYGYRPRELRLKAGQPYRITLINYSSMNHYFTAPEFFRSVATRKAMVERYAEIKAPYFTAFEVMRRGGEIDVYVVPVVKGRYTVYCNIDDHRERGVEGTIVVE